MLATLSWYLPHCISNLTSKIIISGLQASLTITHCQATVTMRRCMGARHDCHSYANPYYCSRFIGSLPSAGGARIGLVAGSKNVCGVYEIWCWHVGFGCRSHVIMVRVQWAYSRGGASKLSIQSTETILHIAFWAHTYRHAGHTYRTSPGPGPCGPYTYIHTVTAGHSCGTTQFSD